MLADGDVLIVIEETSGGRRYAVHSHHGPQILCRTYAEAEAWSLDYARRVRAQVWLRGRHRLQLVIPRGVSGPTTSRLAVPGE